MNNISGRLSKELQAQEKMEEKLKELPEIFKNYYLYLRAGQKTYSTLTVYINGIVRFAKYVCGDKITNNFYKSLKAENIEDFLISMETTVKNGQVTRMGGDARCTYWSYLNTFWDFLVKRDYVKENIVAKTTRPKSNSEHTVTYLEKSEIKKLLKAIDKNDDFLQRERDKMIISIGLVTGLRCSAVTNLNINDVDLENNTISVIEKGDKKRQIMFGEQLKESLHRWIKIRKEQYGDIDNPALFLSQKKDRISTDAVNDMLKKYTNLANIKKNITYHKLRSTLAVQALSAGTPIIVVSKALGHNNVATTNRYADALSEDKVKMTNMTDSWLR